MKLFGNGRAADDIATLDDAYRDAGSGKVCGTRQAVVAGADNDDVETTRGHRRARSITRLTARSARSGVETCSDVGESAVDVRDLTRDRARHRREIEGGHVADLVDGHVAPQRRRVLDEAEDLRESADAGGCQCLDR